MGVSNKKEEIINMNTLFWVRVPVLSEAITSTAPNVSIVGKLLTRAL